MVSITLFEGIILLIISGVFVVIWWGVKRLVQINDDEGKRLENIDKSISKICERLGQFDIWMDLHSKQDDERHKENKRILVDLQNGIKDIRK